MFLYLLLLTIVIFIIFVRLLNNSKEKYWAKYGVPFYRGFLGFGLTSDYIVNKVAIFLHMDNIYKKYPDAKVIATNIFLKTTLIVNNLDNVQQVLAGDFNTFSHRGIEFNEDIDLLADNILFMNGVRWKLTRQKFTPLFTSAKLRNMYSIMNRSAQDFVKYLKENVKKEKSFDSLSTFCSASIGASVFGVGTESTMESPFLDMAREVNESYFLRDIKFIMSGLSPFFFKLFRLEFFQKHEKFFIGAIKQVLQIRREDKSKKRHDFAELCLEVQNKGTMVDPSTGYQIEPTDNLVSAQAFFFFVAGVEPSSTAMFFTLLELSKDREVLQRLQCQIDELFERNNGEITHDDIVGFEYLDQVLDEALRMHPPIGTVSRKATQNAVLTVGNIPVQKDTLMQIPIYSIHHDPNIYPDPEKFNPDRFSQDLKQQRPRYSQLAFGEGNRMCLGIRFARLQVKIGLIYVLRHFDLKNDNINIKTAYKKHTVQVRGLNVDFEFVPRKFH